MGQRLWSFLVLVIALGLTLAGLGWQRQSRQQLRRELAQRQDQAQERRRLEAEQRKLAAAQPTESEVADSLARLSVAEQLRTRLAMLHRREGTTVPVPQTGNVVPDAPAIHSLAGNTVAAEEWQNAGRATPEAALQTALWAAAGGDLDALTDTLSFDAAAGDQAAATFERLPAAVQNEVGTPERLMALLTAVEVPLGNATIIGQSATLNGSDIKVTARLTDVDGKPRVVVFDLQNDTNRWRLQVPAGVVQKYSAWLLGAGATGGGGP
jgi:hypothetical protein